MYDLYTKRKAMMVAWNWGNRVNVKEANKASSIVEHVMLLVEHEKVMLYILQRRYHTEPLKEDNCF